MQQLARSPPGDCHAPLAPQPLAAYCGSTVVAQLQPVVALRVKVMVLPSTGAGASRISQRRVPAPEATSPVTSIAQLAVGLVPPMRERVGVVPWLMTSS